MTDVNGEPVDPVEKRLSSIEREVGNLRVLAEANEHTIKLIAEGHGAKLDSHSKKLDDIVKALEPMKVVPAAVQQIAHDMGLLKDFIQRVIPEHEARLTDLERRSGVRE